MEDLQMGRHRAWDNSEGRHVVSDVIQAWTEQLLVTSSPFAGLEDRNRRDDGLSGDTRHWKHVGSGQFVHDADAHAAAVRKAHPLPDGVAFIFCQAEACVIGKDARYPLRGRGCGASSPPSAPSLVSSTRVPPRNG